MEPLYASIDLGGTNLGAALATADGGIVARIKEPTASHEGVDAVLARMISMVRRLAAETGQTPAALGIGVPGWVDAGAGLVKLLTNFATPWHDVPVKAVLEKALGCPVYLANDARAATLGELVFGHGRGVGTMIYCGIGTGVGGGIVIDGKLRLGPLGAAGEIGHQTVQPGGALCDCGNRGCLETLVSGPAISGEGTRLFRSGMAPRLHEICGGDAAKISPATMGQAARAGDAAVAAALRGAGEWLGIGLANLVTALHPELIVIGGGVAGLGDLLLEPARETILRRVRMFPAGDVLLKRSALGEEAGLKGGIALAVRHGLG